MKTKHELINIAKKVNEERIAVLKNLPSYKQLQQLINDRLASAADKYGQKHITIKESDIHKHLVSITNLIPQMPELQIVSLAAGRGIQAEEVADDNNSGFYISY